MGKIRAVIFDMDGVLIDAKDWHYEALNRALELFGFCITRYDHLVTFDGLPTRRKLEMLTLEQGLPVELHSFLNELKQIYTIELVHARCKPTFIHEYCLSRLKSEGYKIGVASNSVRNSIEIMMQRSHLDRLLDVIVSSEDVKRSKPDPEIYRAAMEKLGVDGSETLVVEDNQYGIEAARSAGAHLMIVKSTNDVTYENVQKHLLLAKAGTQ